ncbi:MAG: MerR family transcriptional regulator [Pseudomonadota bacterium]
MSTGLNPGDDGNARDPAPRGLKSASAFRTISEVAAELEVAQHVLRFWESKFPQVRPLKRGGGRRYYRPADVDLLRQIRKLLYDEGYTIKGVQKLLKTRRSRDDEEVEAEAPSTNTNGVHDAQLRDLRSELAALRDRLRALRD